MPSINNLRIVILLRPGFILRILRIIIMAFLSLHFIRILQLAQQSSGALTQPHPLKISPDMHGNIAAKRGKAQNDGTKVHQPTTRKYRNISVDFHKNGLKKIDGNETRSYKRLIFVHVGKTGGETIKQVLKIGCDTRKSTRKREKCFLNLPFSLLSESVSGYFHCYTFYPEESMQKPDGFLFSIRHPLDRVLSWYEYIHPKNCGSLSHETPCMTAKEIEGFPQGWTSRFFRCFPDIFHLAEALRGYHSNSTCETLAWRTIHGEIDRLAVASAAHMIANYRHYIEQSLGRFPRLDVLAIRTDQLWSDLKSVDRLLGGNGTFVGMEGTRENGSTFKKSAFHDTEALCCALLDEIQLYQLLIRRAVNLPDKDRILQASVERCGKKSWRELVDFCLPMRTGHAEMNHRLTKELLMSVDVHAIV